MTIILPAVLALAIFGGVLFVERMWLNRLRAKVPLRVCVAGTRGKSTVTRYIAAALRASGRVVLAKTTGSKPVIIGPDGEEWEIPRFGPPSVLEQKRVLALAGRRQVEALVTEMMSIGPECLAVESGKILHPGLLVLTNVRIDHEEEMGRTKEAIAASLAAAISADCAVMVPKSEWFPVFDQKARAVGSRVIQVLSGSDEDLPPGLDFPENVRLALAAVAHLGVDRDTALRGIASARADFGSLRIWTKVSPVSNQPWHFAGIFAANEPESTRLSLLRFQKRVPFEGRRSIVLLNLRADRASRTRQWLAAVRAGFFDGFDRLVFIGEQASALGRLRFRQEGRIPAVSAIGGRNADKVMASLWSLADGETVVVGMGNIAGIGGALIEHWDAVGTRVL